MSKNNKKTIVTITKVGECWEWFQIFILGFYELERENKIILKFRCEWLYRLSTLFPENYFIGGVLRALKKKFASSTTILKGRVEYNNVTKFFCVDCSDSPFMFDSIALENMDVYFKVNCPKEIEPEKGFRLTDTIWLPYSDHIQIDPDKKRSPRKKLYNLAENLSKIKPLMQSFRSLARLNSYSALKSGYENYKSNALNTPSKKLMCYFGSAFGPKPEKNVTEPDLNWDGDIMGYYKDKLNHPNEKRAKVAKILSSKGERYDGRVISESFSDSKGAIRHDDLIIPLKDFCAHISNFEYNFNISGYRLSIPSRFVESFIVGTAIVTDKLAVKWYLPFDEEVIETAEMGYLPDDEVDWNKVEHDIDNLPPVNKEKILELYEKKWAPKKVAEYIVKTVMESC